MFRKSIRQKIVGIAAGLIVLAVITSALSIVLAHRVGHLLDELSNRYIPAYAHLARVNIRSMEHSLALRRMMMAKMMQASPDDAAYAAARKAFEETEPVIHQEATAARQLIGQIIADTSTPSDNAGLARIDDRIDNALNDLHERLEEDNATLLKQVDARDFAGARQTMAHSDALRDEFDGRIEHIRSDMLAQVHADATTVMDASNERSSSRRSLPALPRCSASSSP
jgi:adenylate cyclase